MREQRRIAFIVLVSTLLALAPLPLAAAARDRELAALRERHFCEILFYLRAIHGHSPAPRDRFFVIDVAERPGYVQCLFTDKDRKIFCEVASGRYKSETTFYVAPTDIGALARLGYTLDPSNGNYQLQRGIRSEKSLTRIADLLVRTLHAVYHVTPAHHLRYKAPLVKEIPPAQSYIDKQCVPATN
jgi:hypothetical protein